MKLDTEVLDTEAEIHINIEDLSPSGVKKLHAMYEHALALPLGTKVTYDYPEPVIIGSYKLSDLEMNLEWR